MFWRAPRSCATARALGEAIGTIPEGLYPGDYLKPVGATLAQMHGDSLLGKPETEWLPMVRETAIDAMMAMIREDLAALNIRHDLFFSERSLQLGADGKRRRGGDIKPAGQEPRLRRTPAAAQGPAE